MRHFRLQSGQFEVFLLALDEEHARERFEDELFPGCLPEVCEAVGDSDEADAACHQSPTRQCRPSAAVAKVRHVTPSYLAFL
jgi:hypothetical protein